MYGGMIVGKCRRKNETGEENRLGVDWTFIFSFLEFLRKKKGKCKNKWIKASFEGKDVEKKCLKRKKTMEECVIVWKRISGTKERYGRRCINNNKE